MAAATRRATGTTVPSHIRRLAGGHVRVGLEANNHYGRGVLATNEMLVERTVHVMEG